MKVKEQLIDILQCKPYGRFTYEEFADFLLENGVTIIPKGAIILTKEEIAALNEYQRKHGAGGEPVEKK